MNVSDAIEKRQSIRKFTDRMVGPDELKMLLSAARLAPSWKNLQCWKFICIEERKQMEHLLEIGAMDEKNSWATRAPLWLVALADPTRSGEHNSHRYYMLDMGVALQQVVLQAVELGMGSTYLGLFDAEKMASALGVPDTYGVVAVLALGYPDWAGVKKDHFRMAMHQKKQSLDEIYYLRKWGGE